MMKIQLLQKTIASANDTVNLTDELDKDYKNLTGIAILDTASPSSILVSSSVAQADIKMLPKGVEADLLLTSSAVAPNDKFWNIHEKAAGEKIEIDFKDGGQKGSYPYNLVIYLRLENCKNG